MFFFFEDNIVPSFEQMIKPVINALQKLGGSAKLKDLDAKAIELMNLSKNIVEVPHKGSANRTEVAYRLAWARTYLKKYGLIKNRSRGIWSFAGKLPLNADDIDVNHIIQSVRRGSLEQSTEFPILSIAETALAFEQLAVSVIKDTSSRQGKSYYLSYSDSFDLGYDIFLPQGIDSIEDKVYCVIKYNKSNDIDLDIILNFAAKAAENIKAGTILLIISSIISDEKKALIADRAFEEAKVDVIVWDGRDLNARVDPESDYANYLINPKQALTGNAILDESTAEEKEKIRDEYIEKLKIAYQNEDLALFLGAGVSIDAGIPLWSDLIKKLLIYMIGSKTRGKKLDKKSTTALNALAYSNKEDSPITQMRYIKSAFTSEEYYELVHRVLYSGKIDTKTKLLDAIARICKPQRAYNGIKSIVTYNFDNLIEQKFVEKEIEFNAIYRDTDMSSLDSLNIYHVHGFLPQNNVIAHADINLVFSEEDYHRVYRDAYSWSNLTQLNAFRDSTCLFIGCSLNDPNLRRLLDAASRNGETARHFALMKRNSFISGNTGVVHNDILQMYQRIDDNIREAYYRQLGLNIIWIDDHKEIPDILLKLLEK